MRFKGKAAIVTGSTRGVGREIAARLAEEGAAVVITGRNVDMGAEAVAEIEGAGGRASFIAADLSARGGAEAVVAHAIERFGRLDVLINNAAPTEVITGGDSAIAEMDPDVWESVLRGAATVTMLMCKHAIPHLRAAGGGAIVNISSSAGSRGVAGMAGHSASKAAIEAITRSLAVELGEDNIRANTLVLGFIVSGPRQIAVANDPVRGAAIKSMQLLRLATSADVAPAALFLASDEAACITGVSLAVDGGAGCRMPVAKLPGARGPVHQ